MFFEINVIMKNTRFSIFDYFCIWYICIARIKYDTKDTCHDFIPGDQNWKCFYVAFLIRKKWRSVTVCRKASKLYHGNNPCWCARYSGLGMSSWQALSPTPSVTKQRVSDGCNKVLSHWLVSREKKHRQWSYCFILLLWLINVSVTKANFNITSFHWGYNLANYCSVLVQLCSRQTNMFSRVEGLILSLTEAKGECPPSASLGGESWKPSQWATVFQVFSSIQGKQWPSLFCHFCPWAMAIITL